MFALAGLFGMDVELMINGTPSEFRLREHIVKRALELRGTLDDRLAVAIINNLAKSMKNGQGS